MKTPFRGGVWIFSGTTQCSEIIAGLPTVKSLSPLDKRMLAGIKMLECVVPGHKFLIHVQYTRIHSSHLRALTTRLNRGLVACRRTYRAFRK